MTNTGIVYLVGAGPGAADLITLRALNCLKQADVVLYDNLANEQLLDHAAAAEQIYVGKSSGRHTMPQQEINTLLEQKARAGNTVVRLKGGDPYIFGRGGEEALHLVAAGIPFEVVPGVTAACAAAACTGIPLTHRALSSGVSLITGHVSKNRDELSAIDWRELGGGNTTLVFYMGLGNITTICSQLIAHGRAADTPVAVISSATTAAQRQVITTLEHAANAVRRAALSAPTLIIVGAVVVLQAQLAPQRNNRCGD